MKIYFVAIFAVLLASCGARTETKRPNYPRLVRNQLKIRYLIHRGPFQGIDGFPLIGNSLNVSPTKGMELIDDYVLKPGWHKPWDVFLAVARDKTTIAVKYYNQVDIYVDGQGSNILRYGENRRIADLWFADESLVILWNDVDCIDIRSYLETDDVDAARSFFENRYNRTDVDCADAWDHTVDIDTVGIDIWNPNTKTITTTLDIPCTKSDPFLHRTVGPYRSLFNPVCRDNSQVFINDGNTVSLYSINGDRIQVVHKVEGEIWKCVVDGDKLLLEDRVYSADNRLVRHEKVYDISNMQKLKKPNKTIEPR